MVAEKRARSVRRAGTEDSDVDIDIVAGENGDCVRVCVCERVW